jgi:hypothetical protein
MTSAQFRKIELRLRGLLKQKKMVNMIIWEDLDGTIRIQVMGAKTEVVGLMGPEGPGREPPRRTSI